MATLHQRKIIRDAIATALINGSTAAGSRVFKTRVDPFRRAELPAIAVYATTEPVDPESRTTAPRILDRTVSVEIVAAVEPGDTGSVDDAIDAISLDIERAMDADPSFGGICRDSLLSSTEIAVDAKGDQNIGLVSLTYAVRYFTDAPDAANVTPDNLDTVAATTNLANAQPTTAMVQVASINITAGGNPSFTVASAAGLLVGDTVQQGANSGTITAIAGTTVTTNANVTWVAGSATVERALGDQAQDVVSNLENA